MHRADLSGSRKLAGPNVDPHLVSDMRGAEAKRSGLFTLGEQRERWSSHFVGNALRPNSDGSLLFSVLFQVYGNAGLPFIFLFYLTADAETFWNAIACFCAA